VENFLAPEEEGRKWQEVNRVRSPAYTRLKKRQRPTFNNSAKGKESEEPSTKITRQSYQEGRGANDRFIKSPVEEHKKGEWWNTDYFLETKAGKEMGLGGCRGGSPLGNIRKGNHK